jgi:hypothetical protein
MFGHWIPLGGVVGTPQRANQATISEKWDVLAAIRRWTMPTDCIAVVLG